ncbi:MAG: hypothetical protein E6I08_04555 [Chloroflexi bacterium]|nr:MAG: hypothetical protein E6I08_04555 [Chloroflexota bacterium]
MAAAGDDPRALHLQVARAMKLARKRYGTMRRFASDLREAMGWPTLSVAAVYAWEAGSTRIPAVALLAASNLADVSVDQLLRAAAEGAERLDPPAPRGADQLADKLMILEERVDQLESRLAPQ